MSLLCLLSTVVGGVLCVVLLWREGFCPLVLMSLGGYPEGLLSPQPQAFTCIIIVLVQGWRKHSNSVNCVWIAFLKQKCLTDLIMALWLARWHVDKISGPTTGNEIAGSVTSLFMLQLLHSGMSKGQISNKGAAAREIAEPTTQLKRWSRICTW